MYTYKKHKPITDEQLKKLVIRQKQFVRRFKRDNDYQIKDISDLTGLGYNAVIRSLSLEGKYKYFCSDKLYMRLMVIDQNNRLEEKGE